MQAGRPPGPEAVAVFVAENLGQGSRDGHDDGPFESGNQPARPPGKTVLTVR